jgi:hypothetical protein
MKDLTRVNGVKVEARERAKYTAENRPNEQVMIGAEVPTVDEVLLEDGTVLYQCVHPKAGDCEYVHINMRSVTAHQTAHGIRNDRRVAKAAIARAEAAEAELAARIERRSSGSRQAAMTRKQKRELTPVPTEVGGRTGRDSGKGNPTSSAIGDQELAKAAQRVITAWNALQECTNTFQDVFIGYMRMAQTATMEQRVDPQILAKAQQYDVLQAALKGINTVK